ncbi:MAG: hypothetical protein MUE78_08535 [Ilumatobacteraceae bacterium]|nr:hypothetical protein [Ilumatobacteraceae bacterium]
MSRTVPAAAVVLAGLLVVAGCGDTTVVSDATTPDGSPAPTVTVTIPIPVEGTLDELLAVLVVDMAALPERVVENEGDEELLERIEATWAIAEDLVEEQHPGALFGFQQAVDLSRTAVERRRPADASKGAKLADELVANLAATG